MSGVASRDVRGAMRWSVLSLGCVLLAAVAVPTPTFAQEIRSPNCPPLFGEGGPALIPYEEPPRLQNSTRFEAALDSIYRDWHPRRQVRGEVTLWVRVDCEGRARAVGIVEEAEHGLRLVLLAHEALAFARFEPARDRGEPTAVYIQMPFRLPLREPPRW